MYIMARLYHGDSLSPPWNVKIYKMVYKSPMITSHKTRQQIWEAKYNILVDNCKRIEFLRMQDTSRIVMQAVLPLPEAPLTLTIRLGVEICWNSHWILTTSPRNKTVKIEFSRSYQECLICPSVFMCFIIWYWKWVSVGLGSHQCLF